MPAYEISNHAQSGQECQHNLLYWRYGEYVGVGPGAHGRIVAEGERFATAAIRNPADWLKQVHAKGFGAEEMRSLDKQEQAEERLLMSLRLSEGLRLSSLGRSGFELPVAAFSPLVADGLLTYEDGLHLRTTPKGRLVLNAVVAELAKSLRAC